VERSEIALIQQANISFGQRYVCGFDSAVALQWSSGHNDIAIQVDLCRYENGPGCSAFAAYSNGGSTDRLGRAFQFRCQRLVTQGQAQPRVQPVDLDLIARLDLAALQIISHLALKKFPCRADKLFRSRYGCRFGKLA